MIGAVRRWLLGVILTAFAGGLARSLAPKGREQAGVRLISGLMLLLALLTPLQRFLRSAPTLEGQFTYRDASDMAAQYREEQTAALAAIIEEETAAYICDKARDMGLSCEVWVETSVNGTGLPMPDTVILRGTYSGLLASWIEAEVGIPTEKQVWQEDTIWGKKHAEEP